MQKTSDSNSDGSTCIGDDMYNPKMDEMDCEPVAEGHPFASSTDEEAMRIFREELKSRSGPTVKFGSEPMGQIELYSGNLGTFRVDKEAVIVFGLGILSLIAAEAIKFRI